MVSSVPKPPQRIRVEMPAEIVPQPVPEAVFNTATIIEEKKEPEEKIGSSKIHVAHPKKAEEMAPPPVEQLETEAALAVSGEAVTSTVEEPIMETASGDEKDLQPASLPSNEEPIVETDSFNDEGHQFVLSLSDEEPIAETASSDNKDLQPVFSPTAITVPPDEELFQKQYYTIGEVAEMFGANQSQIRFWENEFEILQPKKNKKGDRYFRPEDVKNLVLIRHLLQERRFTIEGAKEYLKGKVKRLTDRHQTIQQLEKLKGFLLEMKANLGETAV